MHGLSSNKHFSGSVVSGADRNAERGIAVLVMAIILVITLPVVGLMFDGTLLFIIKARLQGAVDGAALAGARGLARGTNSAAQISNAQTVSTNYVNLNYPSQYFFGGAPSVPTPVVDLSVANQRTVTVNASVTFPGLFLRYMTGSTTVAAVAQATRRDVNVVMVLDRSHSMSLSNSCNPMIASATNFVGQFAPGRDNLGLITFASSTYINFPIANTFQSATPNVPTLIGNIVCDGSTSSAEALSMAYRQLAALNQPGALNVILFFTDGQPTGVTFDMPILKTSPCSAATAGNPTGPGAYTLPANAKGYIRGTYNTFINANQFWGILKHDGNPGSPAVQVIANGDYVPASNSNGCNYYSGWSNNGGINNMTDTSDVAGLPLKDIWGNSANTTYQPVTLANGLIDVNNPGQNAPAMALNAADSAATNIRNGVVDPVSGHSVANVLIFSIGLGNATIPVSPSFLERVSNDPHSSIYDSTKPSATYYSAPTIADLQPAFQAVASEILRLAK